MPRGWSSRAWSPLLLCMVSVGVWVRPRCGRRRGAIARNCVCFIIALLDSSRGGFSVTVRAREEPCLWLLSAFPGRGRLPLSCVSIQLPPRSCWPGTPAPGLSWPELHRSQGHVNEVLALELSFVTQGYECFSSYPQCLAIQPPSFSAGGAEV